METAAAEGRFEDIGIDEIPDGFQWETATVEEFLDAANNQPE